MSGFVAVVNTDGAPVDRVLLARLTDAMAFRGPDAQRIWSDGPVGLGHTLLATVDDYPEVPQPCSVDGRVWLAGDVRVDGRAELVAKLEEHARAPLGAASDPELVLHAYAAWGERCVEHLIGDFAFAVWDEMLRRLFCARDHMGVRQIYYARTAGALVVSNTLDAVRSHPEVSSALDDQTVVDFLLFGEVVESTATGFADVRRLAAAHTLVWAGEEPQTRRYWTLPVESPVRYRRASDYADRLSELLDRAVGDRLRTDRVALFMSGGLDSASVAAVARNVRPRAELRAYTTVYDRLIPDEERHYSGRVACHLGIEMHLRVADEFDLFSDHGGHALRTPAPVLDPLWQYDADEYGRVASGGRVVLTGQGGDAGFLPWPGELFEQIKRVRLGAAARGVWQSLRSTRRLPKVGLRAAVGRVRRPTRESPSIPAWISPGMKAHIDRVTHATTRVGGGTPKHPYRQTAYESLSSPFWDFLGEAYDAGVTRHPVEVRHPLLDIRVLQYLLTVPSLPHCVEKHLLREVVHGILPEDVRLRRKAPLRESPVIAMLRCDRTDFVRNLHEAPEIARFVRVDHLRALDWSAMDPQTAWANLRPYGLHQWLCGTQHTYEDADAQTCKALSPA